MPKSPTKGIRIVADLNWFGHIPTYHKLYLRAFLDLGYEVISLSPNPSEVLEDRKLAKELETKQLAVLAKIGSVAPPAKKIESLLRIFPIGRYPWRFIRTFEYLRQYRAARRWEFLAAKASSIVNHKVSANTLLFLPYLNDLFHRPSRLTLNMPNWAGLYLNSSQLRRAINPATRASLTLLKHTKLNYLTVLDEGSVALVSEYCAKIRISALPDVADGTTENSPTKLASCILARANGRPIIALLGHLTPRKGVERLIAIANSTGAGRFFFLFAGEVETLQLPKTTTTFLYSAAKERFAHIHAHLSRLPTESAFNDLVRISDILYIRYHDFYASSNVLTKAALFNKPVIVSDEGCLAERVRKYDTGIVFSRGDEASELEFIDRAMRKRDIVAKTRQFANEHSYNELLRRLENIENG